MQGLRGRKTVLSEKNLQGPARTDGGRHATGAAAVGRDAKLGVGRREAGVFSGDAEIGHESERESGAGSRAMDTGNHDLGHSQQGGDEGMVVMQQFADDGVMLPDAAAAPRV